MAVCADEAEEPVEIPTEADGELVPLFAIPTFVGLQLRLIMVSRFPRLQLQPLLRL